MAIVNHIEKKAKIQPVDAVRFQILTHCFLSGVVLSPAEISCLSLLAMEGEQELNSFCQKVANMGLFKSSQTVRNAIGKGEKYDMVVKDGKSKKKIQIHPGLKIQTKGNILLDYKFLAVETT